MNLEVGSEESVARYNLEDRSVGAEAAQHASSSSSSSISYTQEFTSSISEALLRIELELCAALRTLEFGKPVQYIYSPIDYAYSLHASFVHKFCNSCKKVLFLGMNPGPWGMSQTGVPFGEVSIVKDWFAIQGSVDKPKKEHPARPITGLDCHRSEVSGKRFWGLIQELCGSDPYLFFRDCFIYNECPIALMSETGKNVTPAELKVCMVSFIASESKALLSLCDSALAKVLQLLQVNVVIAIGKFAEKRACITVNSYGLRDVKVVSIPHPSPRNVGSAANWKESVTTTLKSLGILDLFSFSPT